MTRPKAIIFDLGKVLLDFDYSIAARKVAQRATIDGDPMRFFTVQADLLMRYETGLLTSGAFYREMRAATGYTGSEDEFADSFADIFFEIEPMVKLQARLRRAGYPTFIFSNTNELAIRHIRRAFPFYGNFDGYILSYEQRAMKPGHELYEVVERFAGAKGADLVYLDDRPENVATGAARGWQAILHETPAKTEAALASRGVV
jgi:HAD superfamily hydrolase (TIGR01509 family)